MQTRTLSLVLLGPLALDLVIFLFLKFMFVIMWLDVFNEQSCTQSRLRTAKKAKLMTQVRFAEGIEVRTEVRIKVRFEASGLKLTPLVMQQLYRYH